MKNCVTGFRSHHKIKTVPANNLFLCVAEHCGELRVAVHNNTLIMDHNSFQRYIRKSPEPHLTLKQFLLCFFAFRYINKGFQQDVPVIDLYRDDGLDNRYLRSIFFDEDPL